jgi:hypothetical protein
MKSNQKENQAPLCHTSPFRKTGELEVLEFKHSFVLEF